MHGPLGFYIQKSACTSFLWNCLGKKKLKKSPGKTIGRMFFFKIPKKTLYGAFCLVFAGNWVNGGSPRKKLQLMTLSPRWQLKVFFVKVQCEKGNLQILLADEWANWDDLQSSCELVTLHDRAHQILTKGTALFELTQCLYFTFCMPVFWTQIFYFPFLRKNARLNNPGMIAEPLGEFDECDWDVVLFSETRSA